MFPRTSFMPFVVFGLLCVNVAFAEPTEQQRFDEVGTKLDSEYATLVAKGYKREALEIVISLGPAGEVGFGLELVVGYTYAVVASCDNRCEHVEVLIFAPAGNLLTQSTEKASVVIVAGSPTEGGSHHGVLRAPGCGSEWCQVGLSVLRRDNPK